jgi:hypothetical protein
MTAVGLLARSFGADKLIPSQALEPQPLDPAPLPSVQPFIPPLNQGQLNTSFQLMGASFGSLEQVNITLTDARPLNSATAPLPTITNHVMTTRDGSFNTVINGAPVGTYRITAVGTVTGDTFVDTIDLSQPMGIYVTTTDASASGAGTCKVTGLPVGN